METKSNRLAHESSPYLLQHAHNPVDWYPWGDEALDRAKAENKVILVSIGYSACHWCHVMERESFENSDTARIMNEHFVNIKIDREERPDLDHIYMDAVQVISGSGGWPLNVFLTPDCKPIFGGTYFPPEPAYNRPSWKDVLHGIAKAYQQSPDEIALQAEKLTAHLLQSNTSAVTAGSLDAATVFSKERLDTIYDTITKTADKVNGGFGKAPKFPQTFMIHYLLGYYHFTGNDAALQQACLSLDKMISGGIYDQIGGGFARYSTDSNWLVPHFEKMLYDNALLLMVLSEAWQITHKTLYKTTIEQTVAFIHREMQSPEFGFYSALDADSEGEEGKFYVWSMEEIRKLLKEESEIFCGFYDVTLKGNWEGKNILNTPVSMDKFAEEKNIPVKQLDERLKKANKMLLQERNTRIRPLLDDKILLGWNALMNTALCKVYAAFGDENLKDLAIQNMSFLLERYRDQKSGMLFHTYKNNIAKHPAFLDDYAYLIQALIHLQEVTGNEGYLEEAYKFTDQVIEHFSDEQTGLFYFTYKEQKDVLIRKKEIYDGAVPSGNAVMAWNLVYLGSVYDKKEWKERVVKMLNGLAGATVRYPSSFGVWADVYQKLIIGVEELVITGQNLESLHKEILHIFMPHRVLQVSVHENEKFPLLNGKSFSSQPAIYLCKDYACHAPVTDISSLMQLIKK